MFRIFVIATKTKTVFGTLLTIGVGVPIVFQAFINIAVAVGLLPVTGQPLPLISTGGTSIWMTCFAIGIILSVSASEVNFAEMQKEKNEELENPLDILHETIN